MKIRNLQIASLRRQLQSILEMLEKGSDPGIILAEYQTMAKQEQSQLTELIDYCH